MRTVAFWTEIAGFVTRMNGEITSEGYGETASAPGRVGVGKDYDP